MPAFAALEREAEEREKAMKQPHEARKLLALWPFNVSVSLFAGTTSFVIGTLVGVTGDLNWPAYYLIIAGVVGLVSLWFLQEPNGRRMWGSPPSAGSRDEAVRLIERQGQEAA